MCQVAHRLQKTPLAVENGEILSAAQEKIDVVNGVQIEDKQKSGGGFVWFLCFLVFLIGFRGFLFFSLV
jgi:hypothetical protein